MCHKLGAPLRQLVSAFQYEQPVFQKILRSYKEQGLKEILPSVIGRVTDCTSQISVGPNAVVVPIPASKSRMRQLGFNHVAPLARAVANSLHCKIHTDALLISNQQRVRQKQLSIKDRRTAIKDTYSWSGTIPKSVVLVDDVSTSLATLETAAQICLDAGISCVIGVVLARAALTSN